MPSYRKGRYLVVVVFLVVFLVVVAVVVVVVVIIIIITIYDSIYLWNVCTRPETEMSKRLLID